MKKSVFVAVAMLFVFSAQFSSYGQKKQGVIKINYSFKNIVEGYDHLTKTLVYLDGIQVAESKPHKESVPATIEVPYNSGNYKIEIVNYAFYEDNWEIHSTENNYSIDCIYSNDIKLKKKLNITIVFDIDNGTTVKVK